MPPIRWTLSGDRVRNRLESIHSEIPITTTSPLLYAIPAMAKII